MEHYFKLILFTTKLLFSIYRITAILKVETDIITNISASPAGQTRIFVKMSVKAVRRENVQFAENHNYNVMTS